MKLPILLSIPHAGLIVPPEVGGFCILSEKDIIEDGDQGAAEIFLPLKEDVARLVATDVARVILDMNRPVGDRGRDGIVKTHTRRDVQVYGELPSEEVVARLIGKHYVPYHTRLSHFPHGIQMGVDCHTMTAGPPPDGGAPGAERPLICLGNDGGTCPEEWIVSMAECFEKTFKAQVRVNDPFQGGHIIQTHCTELPWAELNLSQAPFAPLEEKRRLVLESLRLWYRTCPEVF